LLITWLIQPIKEEVVEGFHVAVEIGVIVVIEALGVVGTAEEEVTVVEVDAEVEEETRRRKPGSPSPSLDVS